MNDNTLAWATEGDDFSSIDFWGMLLGQLYSTSNLKITMVALSLSVRLNFGKKTDDHVVYFKNFDYIC
jgi:hypothetical protein